MVERLVMERQLATRLSPISRAWQRLADQVLSSLGVSSSSGWCLTYLDRLGPDVRQSELAKAIGITEASLARTLDQVERAGFVTRHADPSDGRAKRLKLTAEGTALAGLIETQLVALRSELLDGLPSADIATMVRVFDQLDARIGERMGGRVTS
jgi:MarR family transcriptional regulator for hemolysin